MSILNTGSARPVRSEKTGSRTRPGCWFPFCRVTRFRFHAAEDLEGGARVSGGGRRAPEQNSRMKDRNGRRRRDKRGERGGLNAGMNAGTGGNLEQQIFAARDHSYRQRRGHARTLQKVMSAAQWRAHRVSRVVLTYEILPVAQHCNIVRKCQGFNESPSRIKRTVIARGAPFVLAETYGFHLSHSIAGQIVFPKPGVAPSGDQERERKKKKTKHLGEGEEQQGKSSSKGPQTYDAAISVRKPQVEPGFGGN